MTPSPSDNISHKEVRSLYGSLSLNYKGWWNVDVTGRNDWSSTLPEGNNSFFYPSVSTAFVFTDALGMNDFLSSGKVRASWTRVGNDTDPYQLTSGYTPHRWGGRRPMFSITTSWPTPTSSPSRRRPGRSGPTSGSSTSGWASC